VTRSLALQEEDIRALLGLQLLAVVVSASVFLFIGGPHQALSSAYGGGIALLSGWMLGRRVARATEVAKHSPGRETSVLYIGAIQRFVVILVLFALGMGKLGLAPLPVVVGFAAAQLGFFLSGARTGARDN
jgi:ATP synthase protein I